MNGEKEMKKKINEEKDQKKYPLKCYVMKAIQDIHEVYKKEQGDYPKFTTNAVHAEVMTYIPTVKKHDIVVILGKIMERGRYIKTIGKDGSKKLRIITEHGIKADWKQIPTAARISKIYPKLTKQIPQLKESNLKTFDSTISKKVLKEEVELKENSIDEKELIDWGQALVCYVNKLKQDLKSMEIKWADLQQKLQKNDSDWRTVLLRKDKTISELNQRIAAQNNIIRNKGIGQNLLKDVATKSPY